MRNRYGRRVAFPRRETRPTSKPRHSSSRVVVVVVLLLVDRKHARDPDARPRRRRARCVHAPSRARQRSTRARVSLADPSVSRADAARITSRARRMERFRLVSRDDRVERARGVDRGGELRRSRWTSAPTRRRRRRPGQFIQIRTSEEGKPAFIAVASAPGKSAAGAGTLELLVKAQPGTTASDICATGRRRGGGVAGDGKRF